MILADSSVWIDYFRGYASAQTNKLDELLGSDLVLIGDLILAEVLQGFTLESHFRTARQLLTRLDVVPLVGPEIAIQAAMNYRTLRSKGVTVRKTIDTLIATYCIANDIPLLFTDRDFAPFVTHLGLHAALGEL